MSQVFVTKWDERFRNNVASDLLISGTKGITIFDDSRYTGASNLAVMFYIDAITLVGDCIVKGATILTVSELGLRSGDKILVIQNSDGTWYKNQEKQSGTLTKDWTISGDIKVGQTNNPEFTISHLAFIDSIITQKEVDYIHTHGGIIAESLHELIKGHWPCQIAYDDGVNNVTPDVVSQYNKIVLLSDNHGVLVNYTDDELGVVKNDTQIVIKDFYTKNILKDVGLFVDARTTTTRAGKSYIIGNDITSQLSSDKYTALFEIDIIDVIQSSSFARFAEVNIGGLAGLNNLVWFILESRLVETERLSVIVGTSTTTVYKRVNIPQSALKTNAKLRVAASIDAINGDGIIHIAIIHNDSIKTFTDSYSGEAPKVFISSVGLDVGQNNWSSDVTTCVHKEAFIADNYVSPETLKNIVENQDYSGITILQHYRPKTNDSVALDISGNGNDGTLVNQQANSIVESNSLIPPRIKSLPISTSQNITFGNVGNIKGVTFFIQTATDNIELFELISGDANSKISIVAGVLTFGSSFAVNISFVNGFEQTNAVIGKQINGNTWNIVSLFFDTFSATNLITKFTDGSKLASVLCYSEMPVEYKLKTNDVNNNILYNNPSVNDQVDIAFGWNFNDSSFSGNIDFDTDIGTLTGSANGYTDLATLLGLLELINDSR